jgi:hypothetical protein
MSSYDSSSNDEMDLSKEVDIAMILALHANKQPKHGSSIFAWQKLRRERIEGHNKFMWSYFVDSSIFPKKYFWRHYIMGLNCSCDEGSQILLAKEECRIELDHTTI